MPENTGQMNQDTTTVMSKSGENSLLNFKQTVKKCFSQWLVVKTFSIPRLQPSQWMTQETLFNEKV